ncbi:MAG: UvrD-helicase domain-containing protein [Bacteroidota bacterium]|nr:UvrD-helicase domain-containing protein [Candidatus Kapabacteria bacterium]MDW8219194.1 UvrD-helicase domain-containing protein [Bacteroidota bacterium]
MPHYTREQQLAQSADRHLVVIAGAGAGKTSVLVQRFLHLLFDERIYADVRHITAITFTRKAAAEMHQRISQEIEQRLANPAYKHQWRRIKAVRERFSSAHISTIHSFCARLLREFPIEAGINPNFIELEPYESQRLKERAIDATLEAWLETPAVEQATPDALTRSTPPQSMPNKRDTVRRLWLLFGKTNLMKMLSFLLESAERFHTIDMLYRENSIDTLLRTYEQHFVKEFFTTIYSYTSTLEQAISIINLKALKQSSQSQLDYLRTCLISTQRQLENIISFDNRTCLDSSLLTWQHAEDIAQDVDHALSLDKLITKKGSLSKNTISIRNDKYFLDKERYDYLNNEAEALFGKVKSMQKALPHHRYHRTMQEIAYALVEIARDAWAFFQAEKERLSALDFDDLELRADALLNNPEVCEKVRTTIRFLMIDEFQDTNELQYRIIKKIVPYLSQLPHGNDTTLPILSPSTNLFIVGDPKQSIYRFRGADVRVFGKAQRDIEELNAYLLRTHHIQHTFATAFGYITPHPDKPEEAFGKISLQVTFRLLPEIAAFVNRVAGRQLSSDTSDFSVAYEDIICGVCNAPIRGTITMLIAQSNAPEDAALHNTDEYPILEDPEQQIDLSQEESSDAELPSEAQLLAEYIHAIVEGTSHEPVFVRSHDGAPRRVTYSDIMILLRSRNHIDDLVAALRQYRIPFKVIGGRGFYEQQEILDMRSFLLFLQNSHNDIALAAVLRSPFFGVSDTELYAISRTEVSVSRSGGTSSFWEQFREYCTAPHTNSTQKPSDSALYAYTTLNNLLPLAARLSLPSLLRTILEQTSWRAMAAAHERFEQIEANLEKLLTLARAYEQKGFRNLYDFTEELRTVAEYAPDEAEADISTETQGVQIMTIHAAKGLEAPVVALYDASGTPRDFGRTPLIVNSALGISFKMPRICSDGTVETITTPLHTLVSIYEDLAIRAEARRLLYVALTRAKDHIIVSASIAKEASRSGMRQVDVRSFLGMILQSLDAQKLDLFHEPYLIHNLQERVAILSGSNTIPHDIELSVPIYRAREQFMLTDTRTSHSDSTSAHEGKYRLTQSSPPRLIGTLTADVEGDMYSASQLILFRRNSDDYERLYRLGLPPLDEHGLLNGSAFSTGDDGDITRGTTAGERIHALLQHLPVWMNSRGDIQSNAFDRVFERIVDSQPQIIPPELRIRLQREPLAVAATPLVQRYAQLLHQAQYEYPLLLPVGNDFLIGTVDVMFWASPTTLEIWDWKTHRVGSSRDMDFLLDEYHFQLEVYAYIASFLMPHDSTIITRLLFTRRASALARDDDWTRTREFTPSGLARVGESIQRTIQDIRCRSYYISSLPTT